MDEATQRNNRIVMAFLILVAVTVWANAIWIMTRLSRTHQVRLWPDERYYQEVRAGGYTSEVQRLAQQHMAERRAKAEARARALRPRPRPVASWSPGPPPVIPPLWYPPKDLPDNIRRAVGGDPTAGPTGPRR